MEKITRLWDALFDQIYVVHFEPNNRRNGLEQEMKRVGLLQTGKVIFQTIWNSPCKMKFINYLMPKFWKQDMPNVPYAFDAAFNHYECIYRSLKLGHNRILMLEDDVCFLNDLNEIYNSLVNVPEDADIILFDKIQRDFCRYDNSQEMYIKYDDRIKQNYSAACYSLSNKGIKFICEQQENIINPPDEILVRYYDQTDINRYFIKKNLAVQKYKGNEHKWTEEYIPNGHLNIDDYASF